MTMARLELIGITKRYGEVRAADDISLDVVDGEFLVLLGPSGCGKTTTLRIVAGFIEPTSGSVRLGGRDITALPPWKRNAGLVFQSYALFPHMTVAENIAFGLEMRKMPEAEMAPKIMEALRLVRLDHLADRAIVAHHQRLDRAVAAIAHPASEAEPERRADRPVAVTHALHAATEGVVFQALLPETKHVPPSARPLDHDKPTSLLAKIAMAIIVAFTDPGDGEPLRDAVRQLAGRPDGPAQAGLVRPDGRSPGRPAPVDPGSWSPPAPAA